MIYLWAWDRLLWSTNIIPLQSKLAFFLSLQHTTLVSSVLAVHTLYLRQFNKCTYKYSHYARINCKKMIPVLVRERMPALNPNKQPSVHVYVSRSIMFLLILVMHALWLEQLHGCLFQPLNTLYTDKPAGDLLWTNPRVILELKAFWL